MQTKYNRIKNILAVLALVMLFLTHAVNADAASTKSKALKAYKHFLSQNELAWNSYTTVSLQKCQFALVYIDNNSVPELVITSGSNPNSHADGFYLLYTFKNGKIKYIDNLADGFHYYKKKGVYASVHIGTGGYETFYHKLSGAKSTYKLYTQDEVPAGWDFNGDGKIRMNYKKVTKSATPQYKSTTVTIRKTQFNRSLKKLVGTSKKQSVKKFYSNTAANRKKHLK